MSSAEEGSSCIRIICVRMSGREGARLDPIER